MAQTQAWTLEGLDCANCAAKIEDKLKADPRYKTVTLNLMTKTLAVETKDAEPISIDAVREIVHRYEPHVVVQAKDVRVVRFAIVGIVCANCAAKIERALAQEPFLSGATVDFSQGRLILEVNGTLTEEREDRVRAIVTGIEPDVKLEAIEKEREAETSPWWEQLDRRRALGFAAGLVLFGFALATDWLVLYVMAYLLAGHQVLRKAAGNIQRGQLFDENFLMVLATFGAFAIAEYPEAVAVMLFYEAGEMMQDLAVNHSRGAVKSLLAIRPDKARLLKAGEEKTVTPEEVAVGDLILVRPGERVPLDGRVQAGRSFVETSALTGESVPRQVTEGDRVLSGSINQSGLLTLEVTAPFAESTVNKILHLVEEATSKKAKTEQFITKFARYYTPGVVLGAVLLATLPPLLIPGATFTTWLYRALVFLVISCPCALVVSIPLGFFAGIGRASKSGILIKGGNYLEALNEVSSMVFDKTGTLTEGRFEVLEAVPASPEMTEEELIGRAAALEAHSSHPIATSILQRAGSSVEAAPEGELEERPGRGIIWGSYRLGSAGLLAEAGVDVPRIDRGETIVHLAHGNVYLGYLLLGDRLREESSRAVTGLKRRGIFTAMLTGDGREKAKAVAAKLGLDDYAYELLPQDKVTHFERRQADLPKGQRMAFIGDGINDAPVLARADIGIAMGGLGSDAAIEAADIVLMQDDPSRLVTAMDIAKGTRRVVVQNIVFALGVKGIVLALGALGLVGMWAAVFADVGVALIAILNALRVLRIPDAR